ncbi:SAM-dependent methyltransferase [Kitasatospora sp. MMS16-BH015]|uniref:class I SAM-dependent methyltransferase n=1 Tax=Kitasatospora sp. MMS16-BH015 TaxID=2018025 RepID=UPI000CA0CA25|nr:methyltransferase domain-containing protein [Kitasatospora sp. MMS16-BH015]AUG75087.1 SAM-dependent methyltransferase [Kitasatospora sp. MMS16-BH015]
MTGTTAEYARLDPLRTRIETHRRYSERPDDVERAALDALVLRPGEALLDIGCGTGSFLAGLGAAGHTGPLTGLDYSPAAARACAEAPGVRAVVGDAVRLPFPDGTFEAVTARHMLYHVSDVRAALREAHRVLRPGGRFLALVNRPDPVPGLHGLVRAEAARHGVRPTAPADNGVHWSSLPGLIGEVFGAVLTVRQENALVFPDPAPAVTFALALLGLHGVPAGAAQHAAVAAGVTAQIEAWFAAEGGPWRDPKGYAVLTAVRR